jgi:hypothetical protein
MPQQQPIMTKDVGINDVTPRLLCEAGALRIRAAPRPASGRLSSPHHCDNLRGPVTMATSSPYSGSGTSSAVDTLACPSTRAAFAASVGGPGADANNNLAALDRHGDLDTCLRYPHWTSTRRARTALPHIFWVQVGTISALISGASFAAQLRGTRGTGHTACGQRLEPAIRVHGCISTRPSYR